MNDKELSFTVTKSQKKSKSEAIQKENWGTPQLSKRVETKKKKSVSICLVPKMYMQCSVYVDVIFAIQGVP